MPTYVAQVTTGAASYFEKSPACWQEMRHLLDGKIPAGEVERTGNIVDMPGVAVHPVHPLHLLGPVHVASLDLLHW
jgi:hypothetical protein